MPGPGQRRQHGVEAGAVGQPQVDVRASRRRAGARRSAASRWASRRTAASSANRTSVSSSPAPAVDADLVRAVDQHVGDARQPQQRLERAGAEHVAAQRLVDGEHGGVADRPPGARAAPRATRCGVSAAAARGPAARAPRRRAAGSRLGDGSRRAGGVPSSAGGRARSPRPGRAGRVATRTGPSPRSIASASPRWSAIARDDRRTREPRSAPRRLDAAARARPAAAAPGSASRRAQAHGRGDARQRVGTTTTSELVAACHDLVGQRVRGAGQVDDDRVVARGARPRAPRALRRPAGAGSRPGVPGEHRRAPSRRGSASRRDAGARAGRWSGPARPTGRRRRSRGRAPGRPRARAGRRRPRTAGPVRRRDLPQRAGEASSRPARRSRRPPRPSAAGRAAVADVGRAARPASPPSAGSSATLSAPERQRGRGTRSSGPGATSTTNGRRRVAAAPAARQRGRRGRHRPAPAAP